MSTVALIGPDGAGKTTLARKLVSEPDLHARYLYMGVAAGSSNVTLPTTRLVRRVKERFEDEEEAELSGARRERGKGGSRSALARLRAGRAWAAARVANRVAEEWYRQLLAWSFELRGRLVIYDRHYLFDFRGSDIAHRNTTPDKRLHRWLLDRLYPRPDLVVCLDAPGEVLFARKGEKSPEALEARRQAFLRQGEDMEGFVRVDATRPLEEVYADVLHHVRSLQRGTGPHGARRRAETAGEEDGR